MIAVEPLPEDQAREVVHQIVDGVQHLHSLNIVHLDLKVRRGREGGREGGRVSHLLSRALGTSYSEPNKFVFKSARLVATNSL